MGIGPQRLGSPDAKGEGYTACGTPLKQANYAPYGVQTENVVVNPPSAKDQMRWRRHSANLLNAKNPEDVTPYQRAEVVTNDQEVAVVDDKSDDQEVVVVDEKPTKGKKTT
jgi:hypothetical protein